MHTIYNTNYKEYKNGRQDNETVLQVMGWKGIVFFSTLATCSLCHLFRPLVAHSGTFWSIQASFSLFGDEVLL